MFFFSSLEHLNVKATSLLGTYFKKDMVVYFYLFILTIWMFHNFCDKLLWKTGEQISISYVDYLCSSAKSLFCFESEKSDF